MRKYAMHWSIRLIRSVVLKVLSEVLTSMPVRSMFVLYLSIGRLRASRERSPCFRIWSASKLCFFPLILAQAFGKELHNKTQCEFCSHTCHANQVRSAALALDAFPALQRQSWACRHRYPRRSLTLPCHHDGFSEYWRIVNLCILFCKLLTFIQF